MRLLNVRTMTLKTFYDRNTPPYAILSHTWHEDTEVTFQDLASLPGASFRNAGRELRKRQGYQKIEMTCQLAALDAIEHVWIDTCCIDKSSSAELSEAINSMWRWYRGCAVCYAYLYDVSAGGPPLGRMSPDGVYTDRQVLWTDYFDFIDEVELRKAKWFTRGWTLQELIAPKHVVFYARGWRLAGNRTGLSHQLAEITGIKTTFLRAGANYLNTVSVAERMSWAANRETTRIEDIAYCLMGLFDVNMPLLYGEGEKAFFRLQEEIMKDSDDLSLLASSPPEAPSFHGGKKRRIELTLHGTRSVFASHPEEFAESGDIQPLAVDEHFTSTNKGVLLKLPLIDLPDQEHSRNGKFYVALLACSHSHSDQRIGILVLKEGKRHFRRVVNTGLLRMFIESESVPQEEAVYLNKRPGSFKLGYGVGKVDIWDEPEGGGTRLLYDYLYY